jgi:Fe-S oxidoreductase
MEGSIPTEAQPTLRSIESRGNPYGPPEERVKWLDGLDVKVLQPGDRVDYLYWVGCVSAYDQRKQKIAKSLVSIMQRAGLSFGVLGSLEGCTGDPARRLGEENLFQTMAKQNIELLKSVSFKFLVANCPHCFNTIKNEYPQFGNLSDGAQPDIIHHSVLLKKLLAEEKITLKDGDLKDVTYHDPCYLGRYNDEYEAPRSTLRSVKGLQILEMPRSKEKGLCCGAGGGHFWMDLKVGERVNVIRAEEAAATGASTVATACPFCMQMMEDGVKLTDNESKMNVRDIAEVIAERLA